jgi:hypothetical protein
MADFGGARCISRRLPGNINAEFQQFSVNPGSTPARVSKTHSSDQDSRLWRHSRTPLPAPTLPCPVESKTLPVPRNNGFGLDNHEEPSRVNMVHGAYISTLHKLNGVMQNGVFGRDNPSVGMDFDAFRLSTHQIRQRSQHRTIARTQSTSWSCIFGLEGLSLPHPAAIMGTATNAANRPTNLQRVKCSFSTMRASKTVTAG